MSVHGLVEIDSHREPAQDHRPRDVDYIREGRRSNTLGGRGLRIAVRRRGGYITGVAVAAVTANWVLRTNMNSEYHGTTLHDRRHTAKWPPCRWHRARS